jgi:hypothetical protein
MSVTAARYRLKKAALDARGALPKFRQPASTLRDCCASIPQTVNTPQCAYNRNSVNRRIALHKKDFSPSGESEFPLALA